MTLGTGKEVNGLRQAIIYFGSQAELARRLGRNRSLITSWIKGRRRITAEMAVAIEKLTEATVLREDLRPDLFK